MTYARRLRERSHYKLAFLTPLGLPLVAHAQLTEAENTATWVLNIFSPTLLLAFLTILLIGCGIAVYLGRLSARLFLQILIGSILVFGARSIAPKIISMIG